MKKLKLRISEKGETFQKKSTICPKSSRIKRNPISTPEQKQKNESQKIQDMASI